MEKFLQAIIELMLHFVLSEDFIFPSKEIMTLFNQEILRHCSA